jgi:cytochrome b561
MPLKNNSLVYGSITKLLHWLMAVLIIGLIIIGLIMADMDTSPDKLKLIGNHKAIGIIVLFLAALRLVWKLRNQSPLMPNSLKQWQKKAATGAHLLLYFFMFAMPLSGWAMSSAAGYPVSVFGLFTMPDLIGPSQDLRGFFKEAHALMAWGLMATIALHAGAALLHHFIYKDNILRRMLPYGKLKDDSYAQSDTMAGC